MARRTQQETLDLYTRALGTMTAVLDGLGDQPDPDGSLTALARRIEAERDWVRALMSLGAPPLRPPGWLRRVPSRTSVPAARAASRRGAAT